MLKRPPSSSVFKLLGAVGLLAGGCQTAHPHFRAPAALAAQTVMDGKPSCLQPLQRREDLQAWCDPPVGWWPKNAEGDGRYRQQVWLSPTRATSYGVTYIRLPFPLSDNLILWGFLAELRKREGRAELISKQADPSLPGMRVIVEGQRYRTRMNFFRDGTSAWAVFANTRRDVPINEDELQLAESAREHTALGTVTVEAAAD